MRIQIPFSRRALLCAAAALPLACGAGIDVEGNRKKWERAGITSYTFVYAPIGFRVGPDLLVTVKDGAVVSATDVRDGSPVTELEWVPTIPALFAMLARPTEDEVTASFDPRYGYPAKAYFDGGEEGDGWVVRDFTPL